ncbi:hypothetical protein [Kitasatospora sp. NPDC087315]|uniref:NHL domain-containing protein n=1 Tax=Kitasatospora sp. NPDC087315 TaxID=3364069 RepID=UPI0037FA23F9
MAMTASGGGVVGIITTVAGTGAQGHAGDGGPATRAQLNGPGGMAVGPQGDLYIADTDNHRVRRVSASDGTITTVAGTDEWTKDDNGVPATRARLFRPFGVTVGPQGDLYIADTSNHRVRRVSASDQTITTVAGMGAQGYAGDGGPATQAELHRPLAVALSPQGDLYIADEDNQRVRRVSASDGTITTVAGTGKRGYGGDGGPATRAQLNSPTEVAVGPQGDLYIVDQGNHRVRRVSASDGTITTVAGTGKEGHDGDGGPATRAQLNSPDGVALSPQGDLYIADEGNQRVRRVSASDGTITTVAGTGKEGHGGDGGPATRAQLDSPAAVALSPQGDLYIADEVGHTVRKVTFTAAAPAPAPDPSVPKTRANLSGLGSCNHQKAAAGSAFKKRLKVTATDAADGSPLPGLPVLFSLSGGTGSHFPGNATSAEAVTDAQGTATAPALTAGPTPGPVTISIEAPHNPGSNPAHYQAEVTPA